MIIASLRLVVPWRRKAEVLEALRSLRGPTSAQPGCVDCRILEDVDDETLVIYIEEWGTVARLRLLKITTASHGA